MMQENQTTNTVLMVSPDNFEFNEQTAKTNAFQVPFMSNEQARTLALKEYQDMVTILKSHNIRVLELKSRTEIITPDAVYPNNWFSTHKVAGKEYLILYPMLTENRRAERQVNMLQSTLAKNGIHVDEVIDLTHYESQHKFLEGTGSLILDRINKIAYAALSPRTDKDVLQDFATKMQYETICFSSKDKNGMLVYHTNVMMSVGKHFAVIAAETIDQPEVAALAALKKTNKFIINISSAQMEQMAGNILEVSAQDGSPKIVMSQTAFSAFTQEQKKQLAQYGDLVIVNIETIEKLGGGSARCMLAEIF